MPEPRDEKYRRMIVENLNDSILVEAGAGSGKTTSLVKRMLALIASGRCSVENMAAVTFTRKAAAELKGRFQIDLEDAFLNEKDPEKQSRYHQGLTNLEHLFAGTIHSFCARILRERPIEAGLDPDFEELEEADNAVLRDRCWIEYLEELHEREAREFKKIVDLGFRPSELMGTYQALSLYPEVNAVRKKLKPPDFRSAKKALDDYLDRSWNVIPRSVADKGWDPLQTILRRAWLRCRYLDIKKDVNFIEILKIMDRSSSITQNRWPDKDVAKEQKSTFDAFRAEWVTPCLNLWRQFCHYYIMETAEPAVEYFKAVRGKNALMNFQDLLIRSADLLKNNPEVRRYFQKIVTHILVDEFQDTDPVQAEIILYLTGENANESEWHKTKVKKGALFIVGDPKQSIYRFRRADIEIYNEVKRIVRESGGRIIPLTTNFRSLPAVCDWINPIFKSKFPENATQYQPAFEPLVPHKKLSGPGLKRISIGKVNRNSQEEVARQDAERIASWIDRALKGNFKVIRTGDEINEGLSDSAGPGDFMILLRYKGHMSIYARALEARGIPYEISGGGAFNESEEIQHLLNLLTSISEPDDQVALISVLRGPFFGISDDLLYRFKENGGVFSYLRPTDKCGDKEAKERIGRAFNEMYQYYRWARTRPPASSLSLILNQLGIIPLSLTRIMGKSRSGNLLKALELTLWESSRNQISFPEMVERLQEYYSNIDVEEMNVEPGKKDVVRLMNLHKAKGLEAPVVFLADPLKETSHSPNLHISRSSTEATGHFLATRPIGRWGIEIIGIPPDWEEYEKLETKYQIAEAERLLYVATTRARQLLVVSRYVEKLDKGSWKDLYPYLDQVDELDSTDMPAQPQTEGRVVLEEFFAARQKISEGMENSRKQTYRTETVTEAAKSSAENAPFIEDTGRGMSWGRIIHKIIESITKDDKIDIGLKAEYLLREEERPISEKDAIVALVKKVMSSEVWKRMKASEIVLVEVPFSLKIEAEKLPKIVSGVIDLAFKEPDGWVIADYKSDKVDENLDDLILYYKPQVEMYREFWKEMSKEDVKEAGLYFVDAGLWVVV